MKIGFTIGKFAPLHKGHQYVIETALKEMDKVVVVVYETDKISIPVRDRAKWIKDLYPEVQVIIALNPPMQYGLDEMRVKIQMEYLIKQLGEISPTHFYSSEPYGASVAKYLNIVDRRVDDARNMFPINATEIRKDIKNNKYWLSDIVYNDCINKL